MKSKVKKLPNISANKGVCMVTKVRPKPVGYISGVGLTLAENKALIGNERDSKMWLKHGHEVYAIIPSNPMARKNRVVLGTGYLDFRTPLFVGLQVGERTDWDPHYILKGKRLIGKKVRLVAEIINAKKS